jgi:putative RecB family exonuclease
MIRLSHTSANTYKECPLKYKYKYIDKIKPEEVSSALFFGKAIDKTLEAFINNEDYIKVYTKHMTDVEINGVVCNMREQKNIKYSKVDKDVMHLTDDQLEQYKDNLAWGALYEKGLLMVDCYIKNIHPLVKKVYSLQEEVNFINEQGDEIIGYCDMVAELEGYDGPIVLDFKTSSVKYDLKSAQTSDQLALYYSYMCEKYKTDKIGFIVLYKKLKRKHRNTKEHEVKYDIIVDTIDPVFVEKSMYRFYDTLDKIEKKMFEPNFNSCKQFWGKCDYYNICHPFDN